MADFLDQIRNHGKHNAGYARGLAELWQQWADQLDELVQTMPYISYPTYMDSGGEKNGVELGIDSIKRSRMTDHLHGLRVQADAISAALARGARRIERSTDTTLDELVPPDEVLARKLTADDVRQWPYYFVDGPGREIASKTDCGHGYRLTDSCPGCDAEQETR